MNLKAVYEEVERILADPAAVFFVSLHVKHYGMSGGPVILVMIWDGTAEKHYEGATPEEALAAFRASRHPLAAVEAVEVPEAGG